LEDLRLIALVLPLYPPGIRGGSHEYRHNFREVKGWHPGDAPRILLWKDPNQEWPMLRNQAGRVSIGVLMTALVFGFAACATGGDGRGSASPSTSGTHTVMGRAFFPGGIMVLLDAHLQGGNASGTAEYTQVESGGGTTLRVQMGVECVGVFKDRAQAVVVGPVTRVDGDFEGHVGPTDWWMIQVEEGGSEGDLIRSGRETRQRAFFFCHEGSTQAANLRAVDGDISIL
jgi:hypothetical protein